MMPTHPFILTAKRTRFWVGAIFCCLCLMLAAPKIPHSPKHHAFADMRNFLGVPNTLNVFSNFPFLIVGVLGLVLSLQRNFFAISSRGEALGWVLFYAGITATAFGSAYYHLKPDDNRLIWDQLPMMIAYASLLSNFIIERVGERIGLTCLLSLLIISFLSVTYERTSDDLRLCMIFQLFPSVALPALALLFPPKYTHSRFWMWASGIYLLAKFEGTADRKIYRMSRYVISGHSLEHFCLVMVPVVLTMMLLCRCTTIPRLGELKERP